VIFRRVPVLRDENCHGLGKKEGKGEREERKERKKRKAEQMFCRRRDAPATKGIDGKGKGRAVELAEERIRRRLRSKGALSEGWRRGRTAAKR
jgi:hypothetical protein